MFYSVVTNALFVGRVEKGVETSGYITEFLFSIFFSSNLSYGSEISVDGMSWVDWVLGVRMQTLYFWPRKEPTGVPRTVENRALVLFFPSVKCRSHTARCVCAHARALSQLGARFSANPGF